MGPNITANLEETRAYIRRYTGIAPSTGIILGSGLGHIADSIESAASIFYSDIPHFVRSTVSGHAGKLICGTIHKKPVVAMQGRFHYYEGYSMQDITYPIRVMKYMGVENLIITAAVGAVNPSYKRGDIVFIKDHINFMGDNPLRGDKYLGLATRFPDMCKVYSSELRKAGRSIARKNKISAREGVYMALSGPCYETPAEINAFKTLGADIVGMSVVPEAIVAHQSGINILGLAYVSNLAAGVSTASICHEEVLKMGELVNQKLGGLIEEIVRHL